MLTTETEILAMLPNLPQILPMNENQTQRE